MGQLRSGWSMLEPVDKSPETVTTVEKSRNGRRLGSLSSKVLPESGTNREYGVMEINIYLISRARGKSYSRSWRGSPKLGVYRQGCTRIDTDVRDGTRESRSPWHVLEDGMEHSHLCYSCAKYLYGQCVEEFCNLSHGIGWARPTPDGGDKCSSLVWRRISHAEGNGIRKSTFKSFAAIVRRTDAIVARVRHENAYGISLDDFNGKR